MAHSILTFRNKSQVINDLDLLIIVGFALQIIPRSGQFRNLQGLAREWQLSLRQYGPGVIDLKIEQLLQAPDQVRQLDLLLEAILNETTKYGSVIPASALGKLLVVPGVTFHDYNVSSIKKAVKKLQILLVEP